MRPLFTIGHSTHSLEDFLGLLARHEIETLVDVRSIPWSRRSPHFRRRALAPALAAAGLGYAFLGDALGGRPRDLAGLDDAAERFRRIAARGSFRRGLDRLRDLAARQRAALMCAERDPIDCHRAILIARHLAGRAGLEILHIHADGRLEPQAALERRMVETAGCAPPPLFATGEPMARAIDEAYERLARGRGWRPRD